MARHRCTKQHLVRPSQLLSQEDGEFPRRCLVYIWVEMWCGRSGGFEAWIFFCKESENVWCCILASSEQAFVSSLNGAARVVDSRQQEHASQMLSSVQIPCDAAGAYVQYQSGSSPGYFKRLTFEKPNNKCSSCRVYKWRKITHRPAKTLLVSDKQSVWIDFSHVS